MHGITKAFLYALLLQGGLAGLTGLFGSAGVSKGMSVFQSGFAGALVLGAFALYAGMALSPRFSKRILLPAVVWVFWTQSGALPLSLYFPDQSHGLVAILQVGLSLLLIGCCGNFASWSCVARAGRRPWFTVRNLVGAFFYSVALALGMAGIWLHSGLFLVDSKTAGYVQVGATGVSLEERHFQRGNKQVRLVGMVHIARKEFYLQTAKTIPAGESTVVLMEGVTDREGRLRQHLGYTKLAEKLGLVSQTESAFQRHTAGVGGHVPEQSTSPEYRRADVDLASFQPSTLKYLEAVAGLFASENLLDALRKVQAPESPLQDASVGAAAMKDILDHRNVHLIGAIEEALTSHDFVVVPWGAMHLPAIEKQLVDWGFVESHRSQRRALNFPWSSPVLASADRR
jgi:hypothetical protein